MIRREGKTHISSHLESELFSFEKEYRVAAQHFQELSLFIRDEILVLGGENRVESLLWEAGQSDSPERRTEIRETLFTELSELYGRLSTRISLQLYFHTPGSEVFLRMHEPAFFGDNLAESRATLRLANEEMRPMSGFEQGALLNGFRFVYPLFYGGRHVGSMECGFASTAFWRFLEESNPDRQYLFLQLKERISENVAESARPRYLEHLFGERYLSQEPLLDKFAVQERSAVVLGRWFSLAVTLMLLLLILLYKSRNAERANIVQRLHNISNSLPGAVLQLKIGDGGRFEFLYINPVVERLLGVSSQQLLENPTLFEAGLDETQRLAFHQTLAGAKTDGRGLRFHFTTGRSRLLRHFELLLTPETEEAGVCSGYLSEITRQMADESYMRRLNEELEKGNQRLREILIESQSAREAAEEANRSKSDFMGQISLQIQEPVQTCLGLSEILLSEGATPEQVYCATGIRDALLTLRRQIQDVLDLSLLQRGAVQLHKTPFHLETLLQNCLHDLETTVAQSRKVELRAEFGAGIPRQLNGDAVRLPQLLRPFLKFAVQRSFGTQVRLLAEVDENREHEAVIKITIQDKGIRLSEEEQALLQNGELILDTETASRFGGHGVPLSISCNLLKLFGGNLRLSSQEEGGTEVSLLIPFLKSVFLSDETLRFRAGLKNREILLAGGDDELRNAIEHEIASLGMKAHTAASPREVLDYARLHCRAKLPLEFILLPHPFGGDGALLLLEELKNDPLTAGVSRILLISSTSLKTLDPSCRRNADAILLKPLSSVDLLDTLCSLYQGKSFATPES